jgi:hypothetical protein
MFVSLVTPAGCQSVSEQTAKDEADFKLHSLLLEVRKNPDDPLIKLQAIPRLQEAFTNALDAPTKVNIASALVELGQKDDVYWSILSKRAQEIVDSTAPYPLVYDANGKSIRGAISPEFSEWIKTNNLSQNEAVFDQLGLGSDLSLVAIAGDSRGLSIFRKGLSSPNYGVRAMAARGLAVLQDKASIPLIIEAARNAPLEIQWFIAQPLVAFEDSRARAAADELIPDKAILEDLKQRAKEKGPRGIL